MSVRFRVSLGLLGRGKVEVDGRDVSEQVRGLSVTARTDEPTRLYLEHVGEGEIEGEGIVHVVSDLDQRQVVAQFLASLDVEAVEKDVLNESGGYGDARGPGATVLDVLRRYVRDAGA